MSKKTLPNIADLIPPSSKSSSGLSSNVLPLPPSSPRSNRPSSPISRPLPILPVAAIQKVPLPPPKIEEDDSDSSSEGEANFDISENIEIPATPPATSPKAEFNASAIITQKATTPLRVMALSDKSNMMSTYAEMISTNSIENQLESHKYTVLDRIVTNENGVKVNYVKAYDPNGVIVFIMMDTMGNVAVRADEVKSLSSMESSNISVSDKKSTIECAGAGMCGVALVCRDEICIIIRNNDGSTQESSFRSNNSTMTANNTALPFVIIKMSEIMSDPEGVVSRTFDANDRITKSSFFTAHECLNRTIKKAELLQEALNKFCVNREFAYQRLMKDKTDLSLYTRKYYNRFAAGTLDATAEQNYVSSSANLYARNKIFNELVAITNSFAEQEENIEKICSIVIELNNTVVRNHMSSAKKILTSEEINRL